VIELDHDPGLIPAGSRVRRLTDSIQGAREGRGIGSALLEVWYLVVGLGVCVAVVVGAASGLRDSVPEPPPGEVLLVGEVPGLLLVLAAAGAVLGLAGRLGPVGLGGGGAAWWLPLPVDRRGLLRPSVLAWPAGAVGAGAVLTPLAMAVLGTPATVLDVLAWAALGGSTFGLLVAVATLVQEHRAASGSKAVAVAGDLVLLGCALTLGAMALVDPVRTALAQPAGSLVPAAGALLPAAAGLVLCAVPAIVLAERRTDRIDGSRLRAQGSVGDRARTALLSLDLRELGRALTVGPTSSHRRSLRRAPHGAARVLVVSDLMLLARSPRAGVQVAVAALLGTAASGTALLGGGIPLAAAWVVTGFWAVTSAAAGARHADLVPALDRSLPLSARSARLLRGVVPLLGAAVWTVAVLGGQAARTGEPGWLSLAPAWAVVLAAAALRSAYRPPAAFRAPVASPMGGVPSTGGAFQGLDVVLVATLPTTIALHLGGLTPTLVATQWLTAALTAVIFASTAGRRRPA